jgi:D-lactate dehydrogenase (cytochrome)
VTVPVALQPATTRCPREHDAGRIREAYASALADESRLSPGMPVVLYLPRDTDEVSAAVAECAATRTPIVVSGGRTGIVGGAVAASGAALLSLDGLRADPAVSRGADGRWIAAAASGVRLSQLQQLLVRAPAGETRLLYPVDPTETSASLGGTVATNASGARTLRHGPTRAWVEALQLVLADGRRLRLARGQVRAAGGLLRLEREGAAPLTVAVPDLPAPPTKHTAGYHMRADMDGLDLFVGGEGTLAIVTEVELRLVPAPPHVLGLCAYVRRDDEAERIVATLLAGGAPDALEYMDGPSLELLRRRRASAGEASGVPLIPDAARGVVYIEASFDDESGMDAFAASIEDILARCGVGGDDVWAGFGAGELEAMKRFRHALPEQVNALVSERKRHIPELTKIGTDMAVPGRALAAMMSAYREGLAAERLEHYIFGHIGDGHVHVNIVPRSADEMKRGRALYKDFARRAVALGGSVAGEHGIGRLKRDFMTIQYDGVALDAMRAVKRALDPFALLNRGVMLPD